MPGCGMHSKPKLAENARYKSLLKIKYPTTTTTKIKPQKNGMFDNSRECLLLCVLLFLFSLIPNFHYHLLCFVLKPPKLSNCPHYHNI